MEETKHTDTPQQVRSHDETYSGVPAASPRQAGVQARELIEVDDELMVDIEDLVRSRSDFLLLNILQDLYPADIAHIMNRLDTEQAEYVFGLLPADVKSEVILELDDVHREHLLKTLPQSELTKLVRRMDSDDAADIVAELSKETAEEVLETMDVQDSSHVEELLRYDESTAGGIMAKEVAVVHLNDTVKKAIKAVRAMAKEHKNIYSVYVVDENGVLVGSIPLQDLLLYAPNKRVSKLMNTDVIRVTTDVDQEEVAQIFKKYDLVSLPVTDTAGKLLGRITVDDIVDVLEEEHEEDVARMVGSDVEEMERRTPYQIAMLRLPWIMITLFIQLFAGLVIHQYSETLTKVILLASFMPIISALSGNTGLQAAAIVVRGLATGHIRLNRWKDPIKRQLQTSVILGLACGIILGIIGGVWSKHFAFGLVVGTSMFISINISGLIGSATPLLSKRLGFDPAVTAGPFETAFQDVIGITIFLTIATLMLQWL
ncbi:MAG TPA: magnesium transporter [Bacteroidota bacterium]|nr:magnesium transporter [Bacteroidota bacterium]